MEAKAKLAPPVQAGWTAGDTALLSPQHRQAGLNGRCGREQNAVTAAALSSRLLKKQ